MLISKRYARRAVRIELDRGPTPAKNQAGRGRSAGEAVRGIVLAIANKAAEHGECCALGRRFAGRQPGGDAFQPAIVSEFNAITV